LNALVFSIPGEVFTSKASSIHENLDIMIEICQVMKVTLSASASW